MRERGEEEPGRRRCWQLHATRWPRGVVVVAAVYAREADARERFGREEHAGRGDLLGLVRISPAIGHVPAPQVADSRARPALPRVKKHMSSNRQLCAAKEGRSEK